MSLKNKIFPPKNIFIIASPRSGTTWISKGLNIHPEIYCTERRLFGQYADFVQDEGKSEPRLRCTLDKFVQASLLPQNFSNRKQLLKSYIKTLIETEVKESKKRVLIDKITPYVHTSDIVLEGVQNYFPKSKLVFLLRDGRDVCTSGVFHWFNKTLANKELSEFEQQRRAIFINKSDEKIERFFTEDEITEWACTWAEPLRLIEKTDQSVLLIQFEEMLASQGEVFKKLYEFIGVDSSIEVIKSCISESSFEKMSGRKQGEAVANAHVRKGVAGDWLNYFTYQDGKLFHELAGDMLLKFGYVASEDWFEVLPKTLK